jgi:hypothetical protein
MSGPRARLVIALAALWALAPAGLALARWPHWWAWIAPEQTPMTWLQSVTLVTAAVISLLVAYVLRRAGGGHRIWWLLAGGLAGLAVDERFALHERIRDGLLAPRGVDIPFLPWIAPGDFLLMAVGLAGLVVLPFVWRAMAGDSAARWALATGVALAVIAVGMDSIDPASWTLTAERIQQTAEEIVEFGSGLALLTAMAFRLLGLLDRLLGGVGESTPAEQPAS